jgi:hypothetical protein
MFKDDINKIYGIIKFDDWYKYSVSKALMNDITTQMTLYQYDYIRNDIFNLYNLSLYVNNYKLVVLYYSNNKTKTCDYMIYIADDDDNKAYICYNVYTPLLINNVSNLLIPDINKIYNITKLTSHIINITDILYLFYNIIAYYDEFNLINTIKMTPESNYTFKEYIDELYSRFTDTNNNNK